MIKAIQEHVKGRGEKEMYLQKRASGAHEPWEPLPIPVDSSYPDSHGGVIERSYDYQISWGRPDYTNLQDAIAALRIVEAAVESHRQGRSVTLEP